MFRRFQFNDRAAKTFGDYGNLAVSFDVYFIILY